MWEGIDWNFLFHHLVLHRWKLRCHANMILSSTSWPNFGLKREILICRICLLISKITRINHFLAYSSWECAYSRCILVSTSVGAENVVNFVVELLVGRECLLEGFSQFLPPACRESLLDRFSSGNTPSPPSKKSKPPPKRSSSSFESVSSMLLLFSIEFCYCNSPSMLI